MESYKCSSGLHEWSTIEECEKCCNGHMAIYAPMSYGRKDVPKDQWYVRTKFKQKGYMWQLILIDEKNTAEIERLLLLKGDDVPCPPELLSSIPKN